MELFRKTPRIKFLIKFLTRREGKASHGVAFKIERHPKLSFQSSFWWEENEKQVLVSTGSPLLSIYSGNACQYLSLKVLGQFEGIVGRIKSQSCRCNWCSDANQWPTDIQLPDTQLSDTQLPDIQLPGHSGPRTFSSPDTQVFWTSRSFGHSGPRTFSSPDTQVFWTSSSFGHPGLLDIQLFWTYVGIGYIMPTLGGWM